MNDNLPTYLTAVIAFTGGVLAQIPRVEDPVPETIGLGSIFAIAGACGVIGTIVGEIGHRRGRFSKSQRADAARIGLVAGAGLGVLIYVILVIVEVLFR